MSTVFAVLLFGSIGFLIWGIISPKSLSRFSSKPLTRQDAGIGFGVISAVLFILTGVTAPKASVNVTPKSNGTAAKLSSPKEDAAKKLPVVTTKTVTETEVVPYTSSTVQDKTLAKGTTKITITGVNGVKTLTYQVTSTDGIQTDKKLIKEEVTTPPINEVKSLGTYVKPQPAAAKPTSNCDPNYTGACVPNVYPADVDCGGGSGNGPYYVYGTVRVVGVDRYGLDRDGDGYGCE